MRRGARRREGTGTSSRTRGWRGRGRRRIFQFGQDDVNRSYDRTKADYGSNVAMLQRQYDILAGRQQEQANVSGVIGGGALLEAATKRAANQAIDRAPLDTGFKRAGEDRDLSIERLGWASSVA
jgi:hypothetical protein